MRDTPNKADNVGDTLPAANFNANLNTELKSIVTDTYQTLDGNLGPDTDLDQLGKAIALMAAGADFYADSGAANAYVLGRSTTYQPMPSYRDGSRVVFAAGNTNTGASTVNVTTLGVKNITLPDGTALSGGEIVAGKYVEIRYNLSNDRFHIIIPTVELPRGSMSGLVVSNNSGDAQHDIDISVGQCKASNSILTMLFASTFTKQIDANWAQGTGLGGFPSGLTLSADTWYRVFIIGKADGSAFDAGFDTSVSAANLLADASGFTAYRQIGWVLTDSSGNITAFTPKELIGGNVRIEWKTFFADFNGASGSTRFLITCTAAPDTIAMFTGWFTSGTLRHAWIRSVDFTDVAPSNVVYDLMTATNTQESTVKMQVPIDSSSQLAARVEASSTFRLLTDGYIDRRLP